MTLKTDCLLPFPSSSSSFLPYSSSSSSSSSILSAGGGWDLGSSSNTKVKIRYDGSVVWKPPIIYLLQCDINMEFFPFDTQECKLKMGTWTHGGYVIDLRHTAQKASDLAASRITYDHCESSIDYAIDISEYIENVELDLLGVSARRNIETYPCCPHMPYLDVTFKVKMRRRPLFYGTSLICPCMAISFVAIFVFYLPADSQEKITLSVSVLLSLVVFILVVFDLTPPTSLVVPLVGKYLLFTLILVTLSIAASTVVLNVRFKPPEVNKLPDWARRLFLKTLPPLLWLPRPNEDLPAGPEPLIEHDFAEVDAAAMTELQRALRGVRAIAALIQEESRLDDVAEEWKFVALILDRLFLCLFTFANVVGLLAIFLQAPSMTDDAKALRAAHATNLMLRQNMTRLCE